MMNRREHFVHWRVGPRGFGRVIDAFVAHPQITRMPAALETGSGIWLAARDGE